MSSSGTPTTTTNGSTSTSLNPEATSTNPGFNPTQSSTLYLFTFLATLLLLLAVSCAIVIRSFILRRRFRRRIEEAIAAGVLIPGALDDPTIGGTGRSRRRDFGEKPKLWEIWIDESGLSDRIGYSKRDSLGKSEGKWENLMPISASMLPTGPAATNASVVHSDMAAPFVERGQASFQSFLSRLFGRYPDSTTTVSSGRINNTSEDDTSSANMGSKEQVPDDERLQVAVLISMPNANSPRWESNDSPKGKARGLSTPEEGGEIPDVVFGVTSVGYQM